MSFAGYDELRVNIAAEPNLHFLFFGNARTIRIAHGPVQPLNQDGAINMQDENRAFRRLW